MPKLIPHHITPYSDLLKQVENENKELEKQAFINRLIDMFQRWKSAGMQNLPKRIGTETKKPNNEDEWRKSINMRQFSQLSPYKKTTLIKNGGEIK